MSRTTPGVASSVAVPHSVRALLVALVVALVGCGTGDDAVIEVPVGTEAEQGVADTPLGPSVAVVLPEQGVFDALLLAEVRADLDAMLAREAARDRPVDVPVPLASGRVVIASDAAELRDQVAVLAGAGIDLICVVAGVGDDALRDAARLHTRPTYCELPAAVPDATLGLAEPAEPRMMVALPIEALGSELGRLARAAASEPPDRPAPTGPAVVDRVPPGAARVVAVVTGTDATLAGALRRGVLAADDGAGTVVLVPLEPTRRPDDVVAGLIDASVDVVIVDGAPGADALVPVALSAGLAVLAPEALVTGLPEALAAGVVATWDARWDRALELVVARVREGPGPAELDLPLDAFVTWRAGPAAGAGVRALLEAGPS